MPKVLHRLCGRPMVDLLLDSCRAAGVEDLIVVVSPDQEAVSAHVEGRCDVVLQPEPRGTGHAVAQVPAPRLAGRDVLVLNGDLPLVRPDTIARLLAAHRAAGAPATLASVLDPSRRDARILRGPDGAFEQVVEYGDAADDIRALGEINVGLYCFNGELLLGALGRLRPDNQAGELYLTDVFRHLRPAHVLRIDDPGEAIGVNDRVELARAEGALRHRLLEDLMRSGVTVTDPASTFVDVGVQVGCDTVLEPFTVLRGRTVIGAGCRIGPFTEIADSRVGDGAHVQHSWLDGGGIGAGADCGTYTRLWPGTRVADGVHIGSFAELVRSQVGRGSRVPHVSYLGDTTVGEDVNIGAGTITANYDGVLKNPTVIEDGAFIGVDTMLRAPVRVGRGAVTGAGSVVTRDVPPGVTAVGMPARPIRRKPPPASPSPPEGSPFPPSPPEGSPFPPSPREGAPFPPSPREGAPFPPSPREGAPFPPSPREGEGRGGGRTAPDNGQDDASQDDTAQDDVAQDDAR
jgi:bifunctional UDP-N-acetylglucosamine pyrophosphorylase / glucosamine-1-phosphate N-acetyltransferase